MNEFEARDKCIGQDECKTCPHYCDTCSGKEDMSEE